MNPQRMAWFAAVACGALVLQGCERREPPGAAIAPATASARARTSSAPSAPTASSVPQDTQPEVAADAAVAEAKAATTAAAMDWKNEGRPPLDSPAFQAQGQALLDAIIHDDVERARGFFFPREPFTPLKDAKDPDAYWVHLWEAYKRDIHKLHRRRSDWSSVQLASFELGSPPQWVAPGEEANKIGYYRTWGAKLRYRAEGKLYTVKIHTLISWQNGWHVTHLLPWKKKT